MIRPLLTQTASIAGSPSPEAARGVSAAPRPGPAAGPGPTVASASARQAEAGGGAVEGMGLGEEQFTTLITRWGGFLRHYLWDLCGEKDLAEDLLQNTWLRAWEHRAMVQEEGLARAWLFSIATNVFRDHWRRQAIGRRILGRPVTLSPELTWKAPPEPMDARLLHALAALALEDRQLALLVGVHGCTRREAADLLGISHDTARKRWQRARAKLEHVMTLTASPVRGGASRRDGAKPEEAST